MFRTLAVLCTCLLSAALSADNDDWTAIIRQQPYLDSIGMVDNLTTIRQWVLMGQSYCEQPDRHILFDDRGRFVGWMSDAETDAETQEKLNERRQTLVEQGRVDTWLPGSESSRGYPFALACDQPHVDVPLAMARLFGTSPEDRLWGTWDGLTAGSVEQPVSLAELVTQVWKHRQAGFDDPLESIHLEQFMAQLVVESGAVKQAQSADNAIGILQLRRQALDDCGLDARFYRHRMAQVDCAARLYVLIRRNLQPVFEQRFGHLPADKQQALFARLLMQTYHSGVGHMTELLTGRELGKAAAYFAEHHERFSADEIATGLLYHNLGRPPWGWESLVYLIDIDIVTTEICRNDSSLGCSVVND
ncbi:hypothetical protein [Reinekea blandensis]|uniref:Transglycosylase SLT domain-containing protein n=1 Tax=Reinekea blandensis MED297 TaxID=314283 RepID=A4BBW5_9GAMM|nr:hypothetical protein [Reinekea blandensis]EAR10450.1 hypothetical protein MED297_01475 [Reinekea sp. MED297] [Reinekea blandensis MED297]